MSCPGVLRGHEGGGGFSWGKSPKREADAFNCEDAACSHSASLHPHSQQADTPTATLPPPPPTEDRRRPALGEEGRGGEGEAAEGLNNK